MLLLIALTCLQAITTLSAQGQTLYKIGTGSQIKVLGTSNVHDWNLTATNFTADAAMKLKGDQLLDISTLIFSLPVTHLKGKEDLLTTRAHKALKGNENPNITFKLTKATIIPGQKAIKALGFLTIAGIKNQVSINTYYVINAEGNITCKGSQVIKMSDYNIKAPSYMMGAMKTGDSVTIEILLKLNKSQLVSNQ